MKLFVAGKDRMADLGKEVEERASKSAGQGGSSFLSPEHSALSLKSAGSDAKYLTRLLALTRLRTGIDTGPFEIPHPPGMLGWISAGIRRLLWRVFRYQHDRTASQTGLLCHLLLSGIEFEKTEREKRIRCLEERVERLENRLGETDRKAGKEDVHP